MADPTETEAAVAEENKDVTREDLQALLDVARRDKQKAEERAAAAEAEKVRTQRELETAHVSVASSAEQKHAAEVQSTTDKIKALTAEADHLQAQASEAYEAGDFKTALALQRKMAAAEAQVTNLRVREQWLTDNKAAILARSAPQRPAPVQNEDGTVPSSQLGDAARKFIRDNDIDYDGDPEARMTLRRLHFRALAEDHQEGTPTYFRFIKDQLAASADAGGGNEGGNGHQQPAPKRPNVRATELAVERGSRESTGGRRQDGVIRLSADEREAADFTLADLPVESVRDAVTGKVTPGRYEQYAMNKEALKRQGRA
jgi:hypothetical protein